VVPAGAEVLFNGKPTTLTGVERVFTTPALDPNKENYYELVVRWKEDGKPVERTRKVVVKPGEHVKVDFTTSGAGS
jgi:uncharacterized protein (TIGR03000 family)